MSYNKEEMLEYTKQIAELSGNRWMLPIFSIAAKLGLHPAPTDNSILLLDLPKKYEKPLLEHTKKYNLLIHVHEQGRMLYSGYYDHIVHGKPPKPEGVQWGNKTISIYPAPEGANLNEVFFTNEVDTL